MYIIYLRKFFLFEKIHNLHTQVGVLTNKWKKKLLQVRKSRMMECD
jgi:hypothetical protein